MILDFGKISLIYLYVRVNGRLHNLKNHDYKKIKNHIFVVIYNHT